MGLRGPAPKPTAQKELEGTYRKDRAARNEPRPRVTIPEPPKWLTGDARREYRRVAKMLVSTRVLTEIDGNALALYAQQYQRWVEAEQMLEQTGLVITTTYGSKPSPYLKIADDALKNMRAFMGDFGMTPASRTRISAQVEETEKSLAESLFESVTRDAT